MTTAQKQTPVTDISTPGIRNITPVAAALGDVLNDTYALILKSQTYHWNVTGPMFQDVHTLTEEHYTNMFAAVDVIAERIRALGRPAAVSLTDMSKTEGESLSATRMLRDLLSDHEHLMDRLYALIEIAETEKDPVTADLATERAAFHDKAAWILRSMAA